MRLAPSRTIGLEVFTPSPLGVALLAAVAAAVASATIAASRAFGDEVQAVAAAAAEVDPNAPPSPAEFAGTFVAVTNAYAESHAEAERVSAPHCVVGNPGHYMCAYTVTRADGRSECHLMQAQWTPGELDSFRVTLSGRARKCGSVRQAVRSLR
jgi:hypothetical protein